MKVVLTVGNSRSVTFDASRQSDIDFVVNKIILSLAVDRSSGIYDNHENLHNARPSFMCSLRVE